MSRKPDDRMDQEPPGQVFAALHPSGAVRAAAEALAAARVEFAEAFIRTQAAWKGSRPLTDRQAHEMTIVATGDAITLAQAELDIALWSMNAREPGPAAH